MKGICTPIKDSVYLKGNDSEVAIKLVIGSKWRFYPDTYHPDRLMIDNGETIVASLTVSKFYEFFKIKERMMA